MDNNDYLPPELWLPFGVVIILMVIGLVTVINFLMKVMG